MVDIYNIDVKDSANSDISLSEFANKTLLIVNVASKCGLTPQYEGLQKLYDAYKDCLLYTSPSPRDNRTSRMPSSA